MSYLGKVDMNDANIKHYSLTGSTLTTVDIGWVPPSEQSLRVTINGVVQQGGTFSISGSNLTLGGALIATDDLEVVGIQSVGNIITPADNSVSTGKLADDSVTLAKMAGLARGKIIVGDSSGDPSALALGASTHVLTSDGTDAAWAAAATSSNGPSFSAYRTPEQVLSTASYDKILATTEVYDVGSCYDATNSKFVVPSGEGGKYAVWARGTFSNTSGNSETKSGGIWIYKNGSAEWKALTTEDGKFTAQSMNFFSVVDLAAADELEFYTWSVTTSGSTQISTGPGYNMWGAFKLAGV